MASKARCYCDISPLHQPILLHGPDGKRPWRPHHFSHPSARPTLRPQLSQLDAVRAEAARAGSQDRELKERLVEGGRQGEGACSLACRRRKPRAEGAGSYINPWYAKRGERGFASEVPGGQGARLPQQVLHQRVSLETCQVCSLASGACIRFLTRPYRTRRPPSAAVQGGRAPVRAGRAARRAPRRARGRCRAGGARGRPARARGGRGPVGGGRGGGGRWHPGGWAGAGGHRGGSARASSQQPAASSQQPAASSQQPAASSQQPAASSQQPAGHHRPYQSEHQASSMGKGPHGISR
jgi:hypothetical protein